MISHKTEVVIGGRTLSVEVGKMAKQASGSALGVLPRVRSPQGDVGGGGDGGVGGGGGIPTYRVNRFEEKPDRVRAEEFLKSGDYYWNSGIFVFRVGAIRAAIDRFFPELASGLRAMGQRFRDGHAPDRVLEEGFRGLPANSIDRAVMERAAARGDVIVVEAPFEWDDVGSWNALARYLPGDQEDNHVKGRHIGLDTHGCIIAGSGERLIATIGVRDLVVVETDDVILVCQRGREEKVKDLVEELESRGEGERA